MSVELTIPPPNEARWQALMRLWWPVALGLLAMYGPTYYHLGTTLWTLEDQAHGPLIVLVVIYLVWIQRESLFLPATGRTMPVLGGLVLGFGLLMYVLGRSQDILILDIGSQIPVFAGILLITRGPATLRALWFPLFFILFMIPLPGALVSAVTMPMKMAVSYVSENVLFWAGYPIARSGVVLHIGQYQLLVADACAGLHTLISLEALGLLYLNIVRHDSLFRNATLALLIVPISFTANVIRVMVLTLVTYHLGDEVGQGFVHGFAGMLLFIVALILIIGVDSTLQYIMKKSKHKHSTAGISS